MRKLWNAVRSFWEDYWVEVILPLFFVVVFAGACLWWISTALSVDAKEWISSIDDPTERGLAYVAVAIGLHAFVVLSTNLSRK